MLYQYLPAMSASAQSCAAVRGDPLLTCFAGDMQMMLRTDTCTACLQAASVRSGLADLHQHVLNSLPAKAGWCKLNHVC